jgi:hypothetical protein
MRPIRLLLFTLLAFTAIESDSHVTPPCPKLEVVGPQGLTGPGEPATFSLKPDLPNLDKLKLNWDVSLGTIEEGQGTPKISVRTNTDQQVSSVTATGKVTGLPDGCSDSASDTVGVAGNVDYFPIDEYGRMSYNDERARLDTALAQVKEHPNFDLLFILHSPKGASRTTIGARKKRIESHVIRYRKFSAAKVHFARGSSYQTSTEIYMLPRELIKAFVGSDPILP